MLNVNQLIQTSENQNPTNGSSFLTSKVYTFPNRYLNFNRKLWLIEYVAGSNGLVLQSLILIDTFTYIVHTVETFGYLVEESL